MGGGHDTIAWVAIIAGSGGLLTALVAAFTTWRVERTKSQAVANGQALDGFYELVQSLQAERSALLARIAVLEAEVTKKGRGTK